MTDKCLGKTICGGCEDTCKHHRKNKQNLLYDGFFKIKQVEHNGKKYEQVIIHDAVCAFVMTESGDRILFVKQYRPTIGMETLEIVAGLMDKDISPEQTIKEELLEEAGISEDKIVSCELMLDYYISVGSSPNKIKMYFILVKDSAVGSKPKTGDDVTDVVWASQKQMHELVNEVVDAKTRIGIYSVILSAVKAVL